MQERAQEILMDHNGFFYNPQYLVPGPGYSTDDARNARVEVRFHSNDGYITPDTPTHKYPDWVKQRLGIA